MSSQQDILQHNINSHWAFEPTILVCTGNYKHLTAQYSFLQGLLFNINFDKDEMRENTIFTFLDIKKLGNSQ